MRPRFALALAALAIVVPSAAAFERQQIEPGDSVLGTVLVARSFNEYAVRIARGATLSMSIAKSGAGNYLPGLALYDDDYGGVGLLLTGPTSVRAGPLASSQYRILVGSQGTTVGGYRLRTSVQPEMRFAMTATAAAPATTLTYGSFAGFDATVTLKWKGPAPVTLVSVTGPDGAAVTSTATAKSTASTFRQGGYRATAVGDYVVTVAAPGGTAKWSATVTLSGRLPRGTTQDFRAKGPPRAPLVAFPSPGRSPVAAIVGEYGGPNEAVLSATGDVPDAAFLDGGAGSGGCSRAPRDAGNPPTTYLLYCVDGWFADVVDVVRDGAGRVTAFDAPSIRTPGGSGSATLSGIAQDARGHPTGWTEVRRYDASGRSYELVFSRAEYFPSGGCKGFRVVARLLPDGVPATYDYAPFH